MAISNMQSASANLAKHPANMNIPAKSSKKAKLIAFFPATC